MKSIQRRIDRMYGRALTHKMHTHHLVLGMLGGMFE